MLVLFAILVSPLQFNGDQASVERGVLDGLQPGDRGRIYYLLSVNQREIRIDSTWASVASCEDARCSLILEEELEPGDGYYLELELSEERASATTLGELARQRIADRDFTGAERILTRIEADATGDSLAAQIQSEISDHRLRSREELRSIQELDQAKNALRDRNFTRFSEIFAQLVEKRDVPAEQISPLRQTFDQMRGERMVRIEAGRYSIGEDVATAKFYNQSPRFWKTLQTFWLDRWPVTRSEFTSIAEFVPASGAPQTATAFAQAEAYCRSAGK